MHEQVGARAERLRKRSVAAVAEDDHLAPLARVALHITARKARAVGECEDLVWSKLRELFHECTWVPQPKLLADALAVGLEEGHHLVDEQSPRLGVLGDNVTDGRHGVVYGGGGNADGGGSATVVGGDIVKEGPPRAIACGHCIRPAHLTPLTAHGRVHVQR